MQTDSTATRDIIVIGASAGGVYALKNLVAALPPDLPASIFVALHVSANEPSYLPDILSHAGKLPASHPVDGERIQQSHIYIAPPDHHLLVEQDRILVKKGPKENRFRPSIDALFRSAAYTFGPRVIGVVLTGMLDDGTSGMWSIKRLGGICVTQDPLEAPYPSMPQSVAQHVAVDYTVSITQLADLLGELVQQKVRDRPSLSNQEETRMEKEVKVTREDQALESDVFSMGEVSTLTCPECHGVLVSIQEGTLTRYRCHTGHGFTAKSLLSGVTQTVEDSVWNAIRALEEVVMLLQQAAKGLESASPLAPTYQSQIKQAQEQLALLRSVVMG
ncbi:chemotaxis protein CheB [Spirosoma luteum]|uniref:chemotaxis protein CheB n=1 Tax=Spirosoma luteum TaxID=431553 RepID=UPI000376E11F|nr:chemotaxis protein CheB [Spirosoma luteum]